MEIKLDVPLYSINDGIKYNWKNGFELHIKECGGVITISANQAGLASLANHFLNLAQEEVPVGCHLHFDETNSLEEGSNELIIEKIH